MRLGETFNAGKLKGHTVMVTWIGDHWRAWDPDDDNVDPEILAALDTAIDRRHGPGASAALEDFYGG